MTTEDIDRSSSARRNTERNVRRIALGCGVLIGVMAFVATMQPSVFESSAGSNPVLQTVRTFVPQGWGFFTRDAREDTYTAYRKSPQGWTAVSPISGGSPRFAFGLNRGARLVDGDIARIAVAKPDSGSVKDAWTSCAPGTSIDSCVIENKVEVNGQQVLNPLISETCGDILVAKVKPIPWSYGKLTREHRQSIRIVNVKCES
ncbi:SdpA family antimicrobial peptide system protein [Curtobacterium flaccumfaciens]|uniref:SdpA family antimicrobial peptide system protein n=1 Tax=Curtobacterium flaccumfaciens TaxID=2035 RepID=UPI00188B5C8B|nr:SdpA family antimicrobial peptide system protein [Curtobacterium flaccumfaciens]MBF4629347.1 SdpA family antimicrobial peptide system protein [Curtobacterium flaccumfaciens]